MYANGQSVSDPDVVLYGMCTRFGCLPSQLEGEDPKVMLKLSIIDAIVQRKLKEKVKDVG